MKSGDIAIALFGSGDFAVAPFELLRQRSAQLGVRIECVVSQPDRKAGRGQESQATPVSLWALSHGLPLLRTADANAPEVRQSIRASGAQLFVVIAFGQRMSPELLDGVAAFNLHGSILPAWRGAAPIQRSLMCGDAKVGVSVIGVCDKMDAGLVFAIAETSPKIAETAGELHDRLSLLGSEPLFETVAKWVNAFQRSAALPSRAIDAQAALCGTVQDESQVSRAKKLSRADAWVDFSCSAYEVSARINGLSPWPGVDALINGNPLRLLRARVVESPVDVAVDGAQALVGEICADGFVACGSGAIELLEVQAPGSRAITLLAFMNGRRMSAGARIESKREDSVGGKAT